jgi:predicted acyltransferase
VPVPGVGAGSYAEGANLANWVDAQFLPGRKWDGNWDPEGLLSTLPAVATCLLGVFAGLLLKNGSMKASDKSLWLIGAGFVLLAAGMLWGLQFPVIKKIWTSSFVLVSGGFSLVLLGLFHQIVDVHGQRAWTTIFLWIGANAITLYLFNNMASLHEIAKRLVGGDVAEFFDRHLTQGAGALLIALVALALTVALAGFLYRRKIFLRV